MAITQDLAPIRRYYDETWRDYRLLWLNRSNYAIHFGYWTKDTRNHAQALNGLNAALAWRIHVRRGARILDAGCGVGGSAIWLARTYGAEVVGITPVASQVQRAQRFARQSGLEGQVRFRQEDYARTSFADQSFDVIWAVESVCHAIDKPAFYRESRRLLRPGGRLGMVEYMRTARPLDADGERLLHSWLSGWAIPDLDTSQEHKGAARAAGFAGLELSDITGNVRWSLARLYRMAMLAGPLEQCLAAVHLRSDAEHGNWRGARDQFRALQHGLWFDAMLTATAA